MIVIVRSSTNPMLSASASSACSKHASGARTVPAPICPIPASLWAIPVLMSGVTWFLPPGECPAPGTPLEIPAGDLPTPLFRVQGKFPPSLQIPLWPLPCHPHRQSALRQALRSLPHLRYQGFSVALSPISGSPLSCEKPVKNEPCGVFTGAVNQRSPSPLTRIPNILPLRVAVTFASRG